MNTLTLSMTQTCNILSSSQEHRLSFSSGSVVFTTGYTVTGAVSNATGIIKSITLSSGSWAAGTAAGYITIYSVSGTFSTETITDNKSTLTPGRATAAGPSIPLTDGVGTPTLTTITTAYSCRFSSRSWLGGSFSYQDSGKYLMSEPIVFLPSTAIVRIGDHLTSETPGYNHTYEITAVDPLFNLFSTTIDHIEASLKAVEKRS